MAIHRNNKNIVQPIFIQPSCSRPTIVQWGVANEKGSMIAALKAALDFWTRWVFVLAASGYAAPGSR